MVDQRFFKNHGPFTLGQLASLTGATLGEGANASLALGDVAPLDRAGGSDVSFFDNSKYAEQFASSGAAACFVRPKYAHLAPAGMATLLTEDPYRCYAIAAQQFYPASKAESGVHSQFVHPSARLLSDVSIGAGAVIEAGADIGAGASIGAGSYIGQNVVIGEGTVIGPLCSITHALIGKRCILHRGIHIGQDGFGFALGRDGHVKVPQLGRVVIGDEVEIGSGTTIDRGTGPDTVIGDGTKIDNLVQIGHNVQVGRRVVIVSQVGISGSTRIGDGVIIGGQTGIAGHLKIGHGVRIAAQSGVMNDLAAGGSFGGAPAIPSREWHRQTVALTKLAEATRGQHD
jgi:UDP-3-O-[3-hydroxymyristoyl] glucosamine N-acyltransferase